MLCRHAELHRVDALVVGQAVVDSRWWRGSTSRRTPWSDPADDVANADWHRSVTDALTPFATGYYAGETDVIDDAARARRSFAPAARARLADVRRAYDPAGLFHTVLDE